MATEWIPRIVVATLLIWGWVVETLWIFGRVENTGWMSLELAQYLVAHIKNSDTVWKIKSVTLQYF